MSMKRHPTMESSAQNKVFKDLLATLDLLTVPLMEGSIPGIISSFKPSQLITKTGMLIQHLHELDGQDVVNVLLFFSAITFARKDAAEFLTGELVDKTYRHMINAERKSHQGIVGAAMTLLANIAQHRFEVVMEHLKAHLDQPQCSALKTLALISTKSNNENCRRRDSHQDLPCRFLEQGSSAAQNIETVDDLVRHKPYQTQTSEPFDFHHHLLHPTYGFKNHQIDSYVFHDLEKSQSAMSVYITKVLTDEEKRREVLDYLLKAMESPFRTSNLINVMFFLELLRHPELLEKRMEKNLLKTMTRKTKSSDELEACLAIEAIGNATEGAPRQVIKLKDLICDSFCNRLCAHGQLNDVIKTLQAMSKYVRLLKSSKLGSQFERIVQLCTDYLNNPNPLVQTYSASLFADLAQNCEWNVRGYFKRHVKNCISALLIKLHSKDQCVKASGLAALFHCLPYITHNNIKNLLSADGDEYCKLYQRLGQEEPALLVKMMLQSINFLYMVEELDKDTVLKHLSMVTNALPYEEPYPTELCTMWKGLRKLTGHPRPLLQEASNCATDILSTKWKSIGTVKVARVGTFCNAIFKTRIIMETSV